MKTVLTLLAVISHFYCTSCTTEQTGSEASNTEASDTKDSTPDTIVVLFKNKPDIDNYFYHTEKMWLRNDRLVSLYWGVEQEQIEMKPGLLPEPLVLPLKEKYLVLRHQTNYLDYNDYLLQKGDSVQIEYRQGRPHLTVLNRQVRSYDLGIEQLVRDHFQCGQYSSMGSYLGANHFSAKGLLSSKAMIAENSRLTLEQIIERNNRLLPPLKKALYPDALAYLQKEDELLDSLRALDQMSEVPYRYHKNKVQQLRHYINIETDQVPEPQVGTLLRNYQVNAYGYPEPYHRELIEAVAEKYIVQKAAYKEIEDGTNRDRKEVFAQLSTSSLFGEQDRNRLLAREVRRIRHYYSHEDFLSYLAQFEQQVRDTLLTRQLREEFALDLDSSRQETGSVVLADLKGNRLTLDELKQRHKGKVIYLDFWASWCAPCRAAMPASASLREGLKDKPVVFVYLSIDGSPKPWQVASAKEKLDTYSENYLVVNAKASDFLKKQKVNTIPRYMIFDKTGRLTYANAPRVESGETGLLLTQLAAKP
ncbi:TlpA disulfide reductase family protein [Telluribacter sp. SYSU D00476]|uniref:TlpA family protein disulfide reductase n=1 Tax=Telluribacter sp. SYSU D00476 TaxID=2811430 RepID=UPI001FF3471A|nr:TlpA disulfide reductase family protein [Telluribacter sp. SYSU D00476]